MGRTPDKPGTFRVKQKGGMWAVSAVDRAGKRVRVSFATEEQARRMGESITGMPSVSPETPTVQSQPQTVQLDDFGLPVTPAIGDDTLRAVGQSMGVPVAPSSVQPPKPPMDAEKQAKAKQRAKTICEFLGVGVASADVWVARKMTISLGKDPVNPSAKQVGNLAVAWQDALSDVLADRTIGPWTMAILLSLALPASMMLQSPKKVEKPAEPLRAVS
jgi:hypothetical protein